MATFNFHRQAIGVYSLTIRLFLVMLPAAGIQQADAQPGKIPYATYGLEVEHDNVIHNAAHLDQVFERLYRCGSDQAGVVSMVHIGDSHLQADYMTHIVRRRLHQRFGNSGRGLIVPLHVAGTNEPTNFKTVSNMKWESRRCVSNDSSLPIGVGGITIASYNPEATLDIYMNDLWLDYRFNRMGLFYENDETAFGFSIEDMQGRLLATIERDGHEVPSFYQQASWEEKVNAVKVRLLKTNAEQRRTILYGLVLENSEPGVLYHTIGVNGARYEHYVDAQYFATQTAALHPDLFIISLGTNESAYYPYLDKNFLAEVSSLVSALGRSNPGAKFLLVTPQDAFRQRNKPNPGIRRIRQSIIDYAVENGLAFYDLFRAMGGPSSAQRWRANDLLSDDGIHLTRDGYEYQGNLFYDAFIKAYEGYVRDRHP